MAPIRVELPDVESATSLTQELFGRFRVELVQLNGSWQVEVPDRGHLPKLIDADA